MLEADEIIQQKEWHQLTAEEKNAVTELAGDEAAFNLLKRMLMVSAEAVSDVPEMDSLIQQEIRKVLPAAKTKTINMRWYAAAAAAIAITVAAFFIMKKDVEENKTIIPAAKKTYTTEPFKNNDIPLKDSSNNLVKKQIVSPSIKKILPVPKPVFPLLQDSVQNNYDVAQASIGSNISLLEFVTEVE